jgi:multicomponent Na+:H+ antiporter subunit A
MLTLWLLILIPLGVLFLPKPFKNYRAVITGLIQFGLLAYLLSLLPQVLQGDFISSSFSWVPDLGINIDFRMDGLSLAFSILLAGIGACVFLYAGSYMRSYKNLTRFLLFMILFSMSMFGLVMSANLILLFIFWELTTVLSYFLITFFHEKEGARTAGFQSLFITVMGGLSLLGGIILIGSEIGSYHIDDWIKYAAIIKSSKLYVPGLILILVGVFTKSAQFPFHFWLPGAMQAPAPVSAYLHSATMVKAGFFLLLRLQPVLGGTEVWHYIISSFGVLTMLFGAYFANNKTDIKAVLAFTTINALGVLILLVGIDTPASLKAAVLFLFVHALYKSTLFMTAGYIEKRTGTRDMLKLGGLRKKLPISFIIVLLAALSMAGLPPMLGFIGKELIYEAKIQLPGISGVILIIGVIANALMVSVSLHFVYNLFFGKIQSPKPLLPKWKPSFMVIIPALLAVFSLVAGIIPNYLGKNILLGALTYLNPEYEDVKLALWHGFNDVFWLSLFTVFIGLGLAFLMIRRKQFWANWRKLTDRLVKFQFAEVFTQGIQNTVRFIDKNDKIVNHGYHRIYLMTVFVIAAAMLGIQLLFGNLSFENHSITHAPFYIYGIVGIMIVASILSMFTKQRLAAILALGVIGYGLAFIYLFYSGIDLAITQILAETLIVVLFVLILQRLPQFAQLSKKKAKIRDLIIASTFGIIMTIIAFQASYVDYTDCVSDYYVENSYDKAFGENVVNVILVDFRALDTMGEAMVLIIAALGVFILLTKRNARL